MTLWLLLSIAAVWLGLCALAVSLCVMAGRADRVNAVKLGVVPDRHAARRRAELGKQRRERGVRSSQLVE